MSNIFYIVDDFWGCGWYRCHTPGMELKRRGHDVILDDKITPQQVEWADVVVFQRQWRQAAVQAAKYGKSLGKKIVYELDDDLWHLDPTNPGYEAWNNPLILGGAEELIRTADLVTTTTDTLARQLRLFNRKVQVLPNMLPAEHWQVKRERPEGYDKVAIGWAGSTNRWRDLAIVKEVGKQLLDRYPNVLLFVASGDKENQVFGEHERVYHIPGVKIEQYPYVLEPFDIGICPLVDSKFNQAKSDLKYVEYSMMGIPTVASDVDPYSHTIVNGENGFLAKNDKDWLKYLVRLVESPRLRDEIGARARLLAESRTIEKTVWMWERAYGISSAEEAAG